MKVHFQMANALISSREWEVANLVSTGLSNKQIAHHLSILEGTVRNHLYHIFQKVGVKNRTALTAIILRPHGNLQSATALGRRWQPKD